MRAWTHIPFRAVVEKHNCGLSFACIVGTLMISLGGGGWEPKGGLCRLDQKSCATLPVRQIKCGNKRYVEKKGMIIGCARCG